MPQEVASTDPLIDKVLRLEDPAREIVQGYLALPIPGHSLPSPYFINDRVSRFALPEYAGKGSPGKIATAVADVALSSGRNLSRMSDEEVVDLMRQCRIGVDCSGSVSHIVNAECRARGRGSLGQWIQFPGPWPVRQWRRRRWATNVGTQVLFDDRNSRRLNSLVVLEPGDLLALDDRHHVGVVVEVGKGRNNAPVYFDAFQSLGHEDAPVGARLTRVMVDSLHNDLSLQDWDDAGDLAFVRVMDLYAGSDGHVRRLRALDSNYQTP